MLKRWRHAVQHAAVHFDGAALQVQTHLLAGLLGGLSDHAVKALGNALKLHHAGAQQVALEIAGLACLGNQIVLGRLYGSLQRALNSCHVVHRFGHHAGQLLHAGETVKLQRIKTKLRLFGLLQTRLHLRLRVQFNVAQLGTEPVQVAT